MALNNLASLSHATNLGHLWNLPCSAPLYPLLSKTTSPNPGSRKLQSTDVLLAIVAAILTFYSETEIGIRSSRVSLDFERDTIISHQELQRQINFTNSFADATYQKR